MVTAVQKNVAKGSVTIFSKILLLPTRSASSDNDTVLGVESKMMGGYPAVIEKPSYSDHSSQELEKKFCECTYP